MHLSSADPSTDELKMDDFKKTNLALSSRRIKLHVEDIAMERGCVGRHVPVTIDKGGNLRSRLCSPVDTSAVGYENNPLEWGGWLHAT